MKGPRWEARIQLRSQGGVDPPGIPLVGDVKQRKCWGEPKTSWSCSEMSGTRFSMVSFIRRSHPDANAALIFRGDPAEKETSGWRQLDMQQTSRIFWRFVQLSQGVCKRP